MVLLSSGCDRPSGFDQEDDGLPPAVPAGLYLYFEGDGEIIFEWLNNNEADLKGYNIYKLAGGGQYIKIDFTYENYYLDDSLSYDSTYVYRVSSEDIWGRESSLSQEISGRPENKFSPAAPRFLRINARNWEGNKSVYLSWVPNFETDIAGYSVYRNIYPSFNPDSSSLIAYSQEITWTDSAGISLLTVYYYKICAVDKGGLESIPGNEVFDQIHRIPGLIFPKNNGEMNFFGDFKFTSAGIPAKYKVIVQPNQFFGTLWEKDIISAVIDDTLEVKFDYPYVEKNKEYYWRVISYSASSEPNSITELNKFKIHP